MTGLVERVGNGLVSRRLRLAVAESCTGGLVTALLTDSPGASRFLEAGLVTYSDEAKESVLGVDAGSLATHGAVSQTVAHAMLEGARRRTGARAAIAITGIAGPEGGSPEKPVGTVWIGVAVDEAVRVRRFQFDGDRRRIREESVRAALEMLVGLLGTVS